MSVYIEMDLLTDIASVKKGNKEAFKRLMEKTRNTVTSIAISILKDLDNSEEVAQQVFISVWQNINQLKNNESFLPWLRQMTRYSAYNFLRDNKVKLKVTGEAADQILAEFCDPQSSHEEELEREQQTLILNNFISELPDESREVIILYYREEQSTKQVAQLLELTESNVRKKLSRVRLLLKEQLLEKYGKVIFSTIPTMAFSYSIMNALVTSSPIAAATVGTSIASGKTGFLSKFLFLVSGAMIGVFAAIFAVILSAKIPLKRITNKEANLQLRKYRNQTIYWLIFTGIIFALSYELTSGWIAPFLSYSLLAFGLMKQVRLMGTFAIQHIEYNGSEEVKLNQKKDDNFWSLLGVIGGLTTGYAGLIIGLINSGRM
jgi:RNA polymerase sigma factor (sigma-70 family)